MKSSYENQEAKAHIISLYEEKLKSLEIDYQEIDLSTSFGITRVIKTGHKKINTSNMRNPLSLLTEQGKF